MYGIGTPAIGVGVLATTGSDLATGLIVAALVAVGFGALLLRRSHKLSRVHND